MAIRGAPPTTPEEAAARPHPTAQPSLSPYFLFSTALTATSHVAMGSPSLSLTAMEDQWQQGHCPLLHLWCQQEHLRQSRGLIKYLVNKWIPIPLMRKEIPGLVSGRARMQTQGLYPFDFTEGSLNQDPVEGTQSTGCAVGKTSAQTSGPLPFWNHWPWRICRKC